MVNVYHHQLIDIVGFDYWIALLIVIINIRFWQIIATEVVIITIIMEYVIAVFMMIIFFPEVFYHINYT